MMDKRKMEDLIGMALAELEPGWEWQVIHMATLPDEVAPICLVQLSDGRPMLIGLAAAVPSKLVARQVGAVVELKTEALAALKNGEAWLTGAMLAELRMDYAHMVERWRRSAASYFAADQTEGSQGEEEAMSLGRRILARDRGSFEKLAKR